MEGSDPAQVIQGRKGASEDVGAVKGSEGITVVKLSVPEYKSWEVLYKRNEDKDIAF